jgi:N-methylhydantoinase A/oxoprolinase/acetone carboxylase beta subunit
VEEELTRRALRDMRGEGFTHDRVEIDVAQVTRDGDTLTQLAACARLDHYPFAKLGEGNGPAGGSVSAQRETRQVYWPGSGYADTAIYDAAALPPGAPVKGPAVIEAGDTTHVIPRSWTYRVDEYGNGRVTAQD